MKHSPLLLHKPLEAFLFVGKIGLSLLPILQAHLLASFINETSILLEDEPNHVHALAIRGVQLLIIYSAVWILPKVIEVAGDFLKKKYYYSCRFLFMKKMRRISFSSLEDEDVQNLIFRVTNKTEERWMQTFLSIVDGVSLIAKTTAILIVVSFRSVSSGLFLLVSVIAAFKFSFSNAEYAEDSYNESEYWNRKSAYDFSVLTDASFRWERTSYAYLQTVLESWNSHFNKQKNTTLFYERMFHKNQLVGSAVLYFIGTISVLFMLHSYSVQQINIGDFIALSNLLITSLRSTSSGIQRLGREWPKAKMYMKDYDRFWSLPEADNIDIVPSFKSVKMENITYRYPNTSYVLSGLNMVIERGKQYALVGANGSGKTTAMKLLAGLLHPEQGNINVITEEGVQKGTVFTEVVYQDFARFELTFQDNICMGAPYCEERFQHLIHGLGLEGVLESLPKGKDTFLSRAYENGADLSGGQWQRIAIARALYQNADIYVLDEPTAAQDPMFERQLYEQVSNLCAGKTVIFITHRLASCRKTDKIFFLDDGVVAEEGTFDSLMESDGCFSKMYTAQEHLYEKNASSQNNQG